MLQNKCDITVHNREKLYNCCSASSQGKTGKLKSPEILSGRVDKEKKKEENTGKKSIKKKPSKEEKHVVASPRAGTHT
jgi:hypothetical protein